MVDTDQEDTLPPFREGFMARTDHHRLHHRFAILGCLLAVAAGGFASRAAGSEADLPTLVRTSQRVFSIPFRLPEPTSTDAAAQRVELSASQDFGLSWQVVGTATPQESSIPYRAGADGEYWFRIRSIDKENRIRGSEGPDVRVLVDAAPPRLAGRVWKGADGEIICRYAAADDSINLEAVRFEYRQGSSAWKPIAAEPILSRQSPAHLIGEEIWWAGQEVTDLTVRITVADTAGHSTTRQFSLLPSDPGLSQAELAREIAAPALPGEASGTVSTRDPRGRSTSSVMVTAAASRSHPSTVAGATWQADTSTPWTTSDPEATSSLSLPFPAEQATAPTNQQTSPMLSVTTPTLTEAVAGSAAIPTEYRGRPLHLMRSRTFSWDYNFQTPADLHGPFRVELWITQDAGASWQRLAVDDDTLSPIAVTLPGDGLYGCRLEIVRDAPGEPIAPRAGETPSAWIGIDETPPQISQLDVGPAGDAAAGDFLIDYRCDDPLGLPESVRLSYSPHATGPWATIATAQPAAGRYRWRPHRSLPGRVFVRVEMPDAAGNIGESISAEPVTIRTARFVGTLGSPRLSPQQPGSN